MNTSHHIWTLELRTIGDCMPLLRVLLILRKFRVSLAALSCEKIKNDRYAVRFVLDFALATRIETVFKKIARLFDIEKCAYYEGTEKSEEKIILK